MTIDRVKFTKEFSYHGMSEWLGCEASIEKNEDPIHAVLELREKMVAAFNETLIQKGEQVIQKEPKLTGFAHWEKEINKCTKIENTSSTILDGLESLRTISDMNPKLKEVFIKKLEELKTNQ